MLQSTIGDLLDGKLNDLDTTDHNLYVVRDGDTVFYVGKSQDVVTRLLAHMGEGEWGWASGLSSLGRLVSDNLPAALAWQIELFTPGECGVEPVVIKAVTKEDWEKRSASNQFLRMFPWCESQGQDRVYYNDAMIAHAEELLIAKSHPCLNSTYNHEPGTLPEHYKRAMPDLSVTASDFIPW